MRKIVLEVSTEGPRHCHPRHARGNSCCVEVCCLVPLEANIGDTARCCRTQYTSLSLSVCLACSCRSWNNTIKFNPVINSDDDILQWLRTIPSCLPRHQTFTKQSPDPVITSKLTLFPCSGDFVGGRHVHASWWRQHNGGRFSREISLSWPLWQDIKLLLLGYLSSRCTKVSRNSLLTCNFLFFLIFRNPVSQRGSRRRRTTYHALTSLLLLPDCFPSWWPVPPSRNPNVKH